MSSKQANKEPKNTKGGRPKGSANKRTLALREALEEAGMTKALHPVIQMFKIYTNKKTDDALRVKCMAEVAQYLEPKRKALEVTGEDGGPLQVALIDLSKLPKSGKGVK